MPAQHPIVAALARARPGSTIYLDPGNYQGFSLGLGGQAGNASDTRGGSPGAPIVIDGRGQARIMPSGQDAIIIDQRVPVAHITFRGLKIIAGNRTGVIFTKRNDGRNHVGFSFEDCEILGGFDHPAGKGRTSKWGLWAHRLKDFRFVGLASPAKVVGLRHEHAFYIQNPQGDVLIENVIGNGLGRTFVQVTCRAKDGPPGRGRFVVRNCKVSNVGLGVWDDYRGGTAFTVAGRHTGELLFENNRFRGGYDPRYRKLKPKGGVHGTGAFVAWQGGQKMRNGTLILRNNDFRMAAGCGDRPLVAISGCKDVLITGKNHFVSGGSEPALALEPVDDAGKPEGGLPNVKVRIAASTQLKGKVTLRGRVLSPDQWQALGR